MDFGSLRSMRGPPLPTKIRVEGKHVKITITSNPEDCCYLHLRALAFGEGGVRPRKVKKL